MSSSEAPSTESAQRSAANPRFPARVKISSCSAPTVASQANGTRSRSATLRVLTERSTVNLPKRRAQGESRVPAAGSAGAGGSSWGRVSFAGGAGRGAGRGRGRARSMGRSFGRCALAGHVAMR